LGVALHERCNNGLALALIWSAKAGFIKIGFVTHVII